MIRRFNAFLLCMLVSYAVWGYHTLPARIPVHFNLAGVADGFGPRSSFLFLPAVGILTIAFLYVITRIAIRNPRLVNVPDKKRFLMLSEKDQRWVLEPILDSVDWIITILCILFIMIELAIFRAAAGGDARAFLQAPLITAIIAMTVLPLFMIIKVQRRINEASRRSRNSG